MMNLQVNEENFYLVIFNLTPYFSL